MISIAEQSRASLPLQVCAESVLPPSWVNDLVSQRNAGERPQAGQVLQSLGVDCALLSARIEKATSLGALQLQHAVCRVYDLIAARLQDINFPHAIRFWNFIPGIHARMGAHPEGILDRYMVFNAGRFAAYTRWYGKAGPRSATATGIGHAGEDLLIHCLASSSAGRAVENPRQVPAYRYSARRGPLPPCFARATLATLNGERLLIVGGTSSVRGEASVHAGNLEAQVAETLTNLTSLVLGKANLTPEDQHHALARYRSLRVYCVHNADVPHVRGMIEEHFANLDSVEYIRADVCRRTLLVEIEGVASV